VLQLCQSVRPHTRANAVRLLPNARVERPTIWAAFERALGDEDDGVRIAALETLRHTARDVTSGVEARLLALAGPRSGALLRMNAAHTLAHFAADPRAAIKTLRQGLRARDAGAREVAAEALSCVAGRGAPPTRAPNA